MKAIQYLPLVIVVALAACGEKNATKETVAAPAGASAVSSVAPQAAAPAAPAPLAATAVAAPPTPSAADLAKGEKIFGGTCISCHGAGVLGAPKFGDKAAWAPRIAQGIDTLHGHALNGLKMMPPKGGNIMLKDDEVKAAVDYMVSKAI